MTERIERRTDSGPDDARFDRLVDGELSGDEYRALLASLDEESDGWRRCALAFLEAQALAGELGLVRQSLGLRDHRTGNSQAVPGSRGKWGDFLSLMAVAAGLLLAFSLGIVAPRIFSSWRQEPQFAGNLPTQRPGTDTSDGARYEMRRPVGNSRLVMDGPGDETTQAGQVPVYEVGQDLDQFLSRGQPALGPELIEYFRQHGYDVQHEQQYFPAPLEDGREVIVPVDGYQFTPVQRRY